MKFIDEAYIKVIGGNGGDGCISFLREKNIAYGGPDGGNGNNGGNVFISTDKNINTLIEYNFKKIFQAEHGGNGKGCNCTGKRGKDLVIKVPVGTRILNTDTNIIVKDMIYNHQIVIVAKGGLPGLGNNRFKSSINRAPYKKTNGTKGEINNLKLQLILLADVGMLGLPNSGKSTLTRSISSSKTKIAHYPFTTLVPNLGVVKVNNNNFTIADIPGLIKGASSGRGLGINFLKHLERCKLLLHLVDLLPIYNNPIENITILLNELKQYSYKLFIKPQWLIFNKSDLISSNNAKKIVDNVINKLNWTNKYYIISAINNIGTLNLSLNIEKFINKT
ncbi:MAG: Obg family GTPase CgtA [Enterobacterales bacterium]